MFRINGELTEEKLLDFIKQHKSKINRYEMLQNYYNGKHRILNEPKLNDYDNHRNVTNFCKVAVTTTTGYLTGKPIIYTSQDDNYLKILNNIFDKNDEDDKNAELDKGTAIKGVKYELHYIKNVNNKPEPRFAIIEPEEMFLIYDYSIEPEIMYAVRYYIADDVEKIEIYDDSSIKYYSKKEEKLFLEEEILHFYKEVPVVEFVQNEERKAVFEDFLTLQDDYNRQVTNQANNLNYFTDAYMILENMEGTENEDIEEARRNKVFKTPQDGKVSWLLKPTEDAVVENHKKTLKDNIFLVGCFPDWSSNEFAGNLSGVAIEFKILNMEQLCAVKERKMTKSIMRRIRLITNILNSQGNNFDPESIQITFVRNLPKNLAELADTIQKLRGIISDERLISLLPFIEDVRSEMEIKKKEQQGELEDEDIKGILNKYLEEESQYE